MSKLWDVIEIDGVRYKATLPLAQYFSSEPCHPCEGCAFDDYTGCLALDEVGCREAESGIDFIWVRCDED